MKVKTIVKTIVQMNGEESQQIAEILNEYEYSQRGMAAPVDSYESRKLGTASELARALKP